MKSHQKFIETWIREKHFFVYDRTKISYFNLEDWEWFYTLEWYEYKIIYNHMFDAIYDYDDTGILTDYDTCPSCIMGEYWKSFCKTCEYGENHGFCNKDNSDYEKIQRSLHNSTICSAIERDVIVNFFKWNRNIK